MVLIYLLKNQLIKIIYYYLNNILHNILLFKMLTKKYKFNYNDDLSSEFIYDINKDNYVVDKIIIRTYDQIKFSNIHYNFYSIHLQFADYEFYNNVIEISCLPIIFFEISNNINNFIKQNIEIIDYEFIIYKKNYWKKIIYSENLFLCSSFDINHIHCENIRVIVSNYFTNLDEFINYIGCSKETFIKYFNKNKFNLSIYDSNSPYICYTLYVSYN